MDDYHYYSYFLKVAAILLTRKLLLLLGILLLDLKYGSLSGFGADIYLETMDRCPITHRIHFHERIARYF